MMTAAAAVEGPWWDPRAPDWAELWGGLAQPARMAVVGATGVGEGTRVLDVGCGSGEFCRLAASRGARVGGLDAAEGMVGISRRRLPNADLRVGALENLPWPDDSFDVVTSFNALQFAEDLVAAFAEAGRVARSGGLVAVCNWGRREDCEVNAVEDALRALAPPPESPPDDRPSVREPGVLESVARRAGLHLRVAGEVGVPWEVPDRVSLERAFLVMDPTGSASPKTRRERRSWPPPRLSAVPMVPTGSRTVSGTSSRRRTTLHASRRSCPKTRNGRRGIR